MPKPIKRPWSWIKSEYGNGATIVANGGELVARVQADLSDIDFMVEASNCHDILREALDVMVRTFNVAEIDPLVAFAAIEQARAAIQRATNTPDLT